MFLFSREQTKSSHFYTEGPGPGSGQGHYDRLRGRPPHLSIDQYSESSHRSDQDPPHGSFGREYFSSEDLRGPEGLHAPPAAGRYGGGSGHKRPTIGQPYACQSSPTQPHPPEKKPFSKQSDQEYQQDPEARHGLRNWRIHSYLSSYEDGGEEGLPQPLGPDAFEDPQPSQQTTDTDSSSRFGLKEQPNAAPKPRQEVPRPRYGKPILPESNSKDTAPTTMDLDLKPSALEKRERETDRAKEGGTDVEMKDTPDLFLSKHESFRSRINPLLQRSSRLRSSLIFSSSKAEMHSGSLGLKPASETEEELDPIRTTSIVAQILEKRRSLSREPFDWRKKAEEKDKEKEKDQEQEKEKEKEEQQKEIERQQKEKEEQKEKERQLKEKEKEEREKERLQKEKDEQRKEKERLQELKKKDETKAKEEPRTFKEAVASSLNMNDPASRLQYFQDLAAKRKASKMESESSLKAPEPAEKKPDLSDKPPVNPPTTSKIPTVTVSSAEPEPKRPDISAKLAELTRKPSFTSSKPPIITAKPYVSPHQKASEANQAQKEESSSEGQKKDLFKSLKPLPSPKIFRRDPLKLKGLNPRRISCGDEILTTDATDAEKSELKKNRSQSSSTLPRDEGLQKVMGSNTSINTLGETKEGKTLDFLKKQTQRLKGFLGPKDKEKKSSGDDKSMSTVVENTADSSKKASSIGKSTGPTPTDQTAANHKTSTTTTSGQTRYLAQGGSVIFSSNLRDDTKVILEQISANSQKNRQEREETAGANGSDAAEKALERQNSIKKSRFLRPPGTSQEREGLLKRIESLRKEKKVYSRFEVVYHRKDDVCSVDGRDI